MSDNHPYDAYSPREIAGRVREFCIAKARLSLLSLAMLGVLAGAFIGLGALMFTLVTSDDSLGFAASRLLGGLSFSLGLVLVTVAGAELFTGQQHAGDGVGRWLREHEAGSAQLDSGGAAPTSRAPLGWRCSSGCRGMPA